MKKKLVVSAMLAALLAGSLACIGCSLEGGGGGGGGVRKFFTEGPPKGGTPQKN
jgi:hypothetical protein